MQNLLIVLTVVVAAVIGILFDWLIKPLLPEKRTARHSFAIIIALAILLFGYSLLPTNIQELIPATPTVENDADSGEQTTLPIERFEVISLENYSELSAPETNLGLSPGEYAISDVPFSVGWKSSTQCSHIPERPETISVTTNIINPKFAYLLLQAGWGWANYRDKKIGEVVFNFSDGSTTTSSLSLGYNIRDWSRDNGNAVTVIFSPDVIPVWEGTAPDGGRGGIDMLTIRIPNDKVNLTLTSIEIRDTSQSLLSDVDPCIHLIAMTIKYIQ